jgi:protein-tyrosine phosphatase
MRTELHWVEGPWSGKLALASRPRGGDWLEDELAGWKQAGIETVVSLLTPNEERDLDLQGESRQAKKNGMKFRSFPIEDRQVPHSESEVASFVEEIDADLSAGNNIVVHCRQGIGRSGLIGACLLISRGLSPGAAVEVLSAARDVPVPETAEQRRWIDHYAASLAGTE